MPNHKLPYFGEIENDSLKEYYSVDVNLGCRNIQIDINFKTKSVENKTLVTIRKFLSEIEEFDKKNILEYNKDFRQKGETDAYIQFYIEELFEEELKELININDNKKNQKSQLLEKLELIRIGLYPNEKEAIGYFGVFDYSIKIEGEFCNQLLVVKTNEKGELEDITWES